MRSHHSAMLLYCSLIPRFEKRAVKTDANGACYLIVKRRCCKPIVLSLLRALPPVPGGAGGILREFLNPMRYFQFPGPSGEKSGLVPIGILSSRAAPSLPPTMFRTRCPGHLAALYRVIYARIEYSTAFLAKGGMKPRLKNIGKQLDIKHN